MSDDRKAVFLSYASQDVEAARRICEALRVAGVEVWFDADGGLEHGDEWDAKIRRQIKECMLFIPVISANTQARPEGYFRVEWELAAQRAMGIASGVPFILPVVIDTTREPDALVPDRFRVVQWTRLPGGNVPSSVQQHLVRLWADRTGGMRTDRPPAGDDRMAANAANAAARLGAAGTKKYAYAAAVLVVIFVAGGWWRFSDRSHAATAPSTPHPAAPVAGAESPAGSGGPSAEARNLVAKVWVELERIHLDPPILATAEELARRAAALDPLNPDVWAAWSQVDSWYGYMQYDSSPRRIESARANAEHALRLSPTSFEARLAQAVYLVRAHGEITLPPNPTQAEDLLNGLLKEQPDEPRTLLTAAILERNLMHWPQARVLFRRLAQNPAFAASAWAELGYAEDRAGDDAAAEAAADRSIQIQPYATNLTLKLYLAMERGDLDTAEATLDRIPSDIAEEDKVVSIAARVEYLRRDPAALLRRLEPITREWLHSVDYDGPTALWLGCARQMAGEAAAARFQWEIGLKLVERRLDENASSGALIKWKGVFQALLGDHAESEKTLALASQLKVGPREGPPGDFVAHARLLNGNAAAEIAWLEAHPDYVRSPRFRFGAFYDPIRDDPRVQALVRAAEKSDASPTPRLPLAGDPAARLPH
jgi:tetratricopeptide (TPR) repeat protein